MDKGAFGSMIGVVKESLLSVGLFPQLSIKRGGLRSWSILRLDCYDYIER